MLPLLKKTGVCWVPVLLGPDVFECKSTLTFDLAGKSGLEFLEDVVDDEGPQTTSLRMLIKLLVMLCRPAGPLAWIPSKL